jgi:hypothetical protein
MERREKGVVFLAYVVMTITALLALGVAGFAAYVYFI